MDQLVTVIDQYLETFPYTRWKSLFGYQGRLKDTHFFCGYIPRDNRIEILIRTTPSQQTKAKKHLAHAQSFSHAKDWTEVFITSLKDFQEVQPFIEQAYKYVLTLKRDKDERTLKY